MTPRNLPPMEHAMSHTIPFPHPGETLRLDYLEPLAMSAHALAVTLGVPPMRIHLIVHGRRAITAPTAIRLASYFDTTPQFWMNLQTEYELRHAAKDFGAGELRAIQSRKVERARTARPAPPSVRPAQPLQRRRSPRTRQPGTVRNSAHST
jgi:addiction module HigA family antidote